MKNIGVRFALSGAVLALAGVAIFSSVRAAPPSASAQRSQESQEYQRWLSAHLAKAESIRPGMTRKDVTALFVLSPEKANSRRPYALRDCPLIKVDLSFLPTQYRDPKYWRLQDHHSMWEGHTEQNSDVITRVSVPYLAR